MDDLESPRDDTEQWIEAHRVRSLDARLEDLTGLERPKRAVQALAWGLAHPDELRAAGGSVPPAVLLTGPVGCGKTSLARALAGMVAEHVVFIELTASELTPARVAALTRYAVRLDRPLVIFIDELSWLGMDRSDRRHDPESRAVLYAVLAAISGLRDPGHAPVLWLGATSDADDLDPALTRPGRFGHVIEVLAPDAATRQAHLERLLTTRRTAGPIDLGPIVEMTAGASFASLDQLVDDGLALALADADGAGDPAPGDAPAARTPGAVDLRHLRDAALARGHTTAARERSPDELWRAAAHEAGHALSAAIALSVDAVRAVTVAPRVVDHSGGHTTIGEPSDEGAERSQTESELRAQASIALASLIAERLLLGESSSGGAEDVRRAGQLLVERLECGVDEAWPVAWPAWLDLGPAMADRRAAVLWSSMERCQAAAAEMLDAHRAGLALFARRLLAAGHLAGPELRQALLDALAADGPDGALRVVA
jgi:ATP-dependent Zn protease